MIQPNLNHLLYFIKLAEIKSYTLAADELHISQPTLSLAVKSLENELGVKLVVKKNNKIELTEYGKIYLKYAIDATNVLQNAENKLKEIASDYSGNINFGYIYTIGQDIGPSIAKKFLNQNKGYDIKFNFTVGKTDKIVDMVKSGKIDVGLCSIVENTNLTFNTFKKENLVVVLQNSHPLSFKKIINPNDLEGRDLIMFSKGSGLRKYLDDAFFFENFHPRVSYEIEDDISMIGLIKNDFGIGIMPDLPIIDKFSLTKIPLKLKTKPRYLYSVSNNEYIKLPVVNSFIKFLEDYEEKSK